MKTDKQLPLISLFLAFAGHEQAHDSDDINVCCFLFWCVFLNQTEVCVFEVWDIPWQATTTLLKQKCQPKGRSVSNQTSGSLFLIDLIFPFFFLLIHLIFSFLYIYFLFIYTCCLLEIQDLMHKRDLASYIKQQQKLEREQNQITHTGLFFLWLKYS